MNQQLNKPSFFRFKKLNGKFLLTNDTGAYVFLNPREFDNFSSDKIEKLHPDRHLELQSKGFVKAHLNLEELAKKYCSKHGFLGAGTNLHIIVVTLRCDHGCIYCQTDSQDTTTKQLDMDTKTARQVVDRIFESPNPALNIEFQGGEPLLNFGTIQFITDYALKKNKKAKRKLLISLVSNLASMDEEKFNYLIKKKISLCTSLDGPEKIHGRNRIYLNGKSSYRKTIKWFKKFQDSFQKNITPHRPNALTTISKFSLPYPKEIVDEYINLGCREIHLRPLNPFGIAKTRWQTIGYSSDEFMRFYKKALDYILLKNHKGIKIYERMASIFLEKIFSDIDPNYLDMRSPCGAGTGQLAYNFNGDVYTCDEGRMMSRMGDESFKLGNVHKDNYEDILSHQTVKAISIASCLENLPGCSACVYLPYCGVCPIYNYTERGNIFGQEPHNARCSLYRGILDYLFGKLEDPKNLTIFQEWLDYKKVN